jgi:DNA-binding transcriptional MerR regulator
MIPPLLIAQVNSLKSQGLSAEEISEALTMDLADVKLMFVDTKKQETLDDITDVEFKMLTQKAMNLALAAESEKVQADMTKFLIERKRPRASRSAQDTGVTIDQINQLIIAGQTEYLKLLNTRTQQLTEAIPV